MNKVKRVAIILSVIIISMLVAPFVILKIINAEAGMLVTLLLFMVIYPIVSIWIGIVSGKDKKYFWFMPATVAILFWIFSSLMYQTMFPVVYSSVYFILCSASMLLTVIVERRK